MVSIRSLRRIFSSYSRRRERRSVRRASRCSICGATKSARTTTNPTGPGEPTAWHVGFRSDAVPSMLPKDVWCRFGAKNGGHRSIPEEDAQCGRAAHLPTAWGQRGVSFRLDQGPDELRKFRLFGLRKAGIEALWAALAYNVMLRIRAVRKRTLVQLAAAQRGVQRRMCLTPFRPADRLSSSPVASVRKLI